ncbi:hypothetical protein L3X38_023535 [Prunus dulcis]|uniref:CCHC-type domain-containing protein n=1 Tax=Prunus dulcis TaxID=3755 RepID=A0AAD4VXZ6_PRUDU|nr:hypothetical protein L3X38_023535 [Prunus dulcis]
MPPSRICSWELTEQLPRVVTHPGIAPASNSLNFGVPTNPKPVSSQKASHYEDARSRLILRVMSEEGCEVLSETQKSLQVKLKLLKDGPSNNEVGGSSSQTQYMKDHKRVRCKGRSKGVTGAKEKAMKRGIRHCRECGHIGHDRRQCPALNTP